MISLLCPSRYRPTELASMAWSAYGRADEPKQVEVRVVLDDDDPELENYARVARESPMKVELSVHARGVMSDLWNRAAEQAEGEILMLCADDIRFRTPGWDRLVKIKFGEYLDDIALVYGRDGNKDEGMATHPFLHRRWVETVGYFSPPHFVSDHNDLWLHEVAEEIGRLAFIPELLIEHMHPAFGKGKIDRNHEERLERQRLEDPYSTYVETQAGRDRDVALLRKAMDG